jgi:hypothetical protein
VSTSLAQLQIEGRTLLAAFPETVLPTVFSGSDPDISLSVEDPDVGSDPDSDSDTDSDIDA